MSILSGAKAYLQRQLTKASKPLLRVAERQLVLQAVAHARSNRERTCLKGLHDAEFRAFSQWGEDGIIDWLVERLPSIEPSFVEFGVEDYREANTRLLLELRNWRGLVMDGAGSNIDDIRRQEIHWRYDLQAEQAFIDRDNINRLIGDAGLSGDIGLLSVDIDGNDYWVWKAIEAVSPAIVVSEFNAILGDRYALTVPYRPDFQRKLAHHSLLYFGASLPALIALGKDKGYTFVGTTSTGCNAFFIRDDLAPGIVAALDNVWAFPSAFREARGGGGKLTFASGVARRDIIADLPLINVETGSATTLATSGDIYSSEWSIAKAIRL